MGEYSNELFGMPQTFMMGDIRALQQMYGADFSTNSTATTYTWSRNTGEAYVNGELSLDPGANRIFMTIWDGGGYDTYDLSNYTTDLQIDLTPAAPPSSPTCRRPGSATAISRGETSTTRCNTRATRDP